MSWAFLEASNALVGNRLDWFKTQGLWPKATRPGFSVCHLGKIDPMYLNYCLLLGLNETLIIM